MNTEGWLISVRVEGELTGLTVETGTVTNVGELEVVTSILEGAANRYLDLEAEAIGSTRVQCSRMEKGFEQSSIGARIFPRISWAISEGTFEMGLSSR